MKSFATTSRTTLIEQMRARTKQLLGDAKAAAEYPRELARLRDSVDEHGEGWVAETAAYTWFNRLTAARYMDANRLSGPYGVVSPESGSASALPEILARAQAGEFPTELPGTVQTTVTDVLTGRRTSADPDAEAYSLLLAAVFRAWHKPMPEVFPAAVDWIGLFTPVDILASTSVRAHAVEAMDAAACENVEVVGWLYQFYNAELKQQINDSKVPIDAAEIAPVTQLFTPHWIVRYLVENSLGRLWLRSQPSSELRNHMNYYIEPVAGQEDTGVTVGSPEEIRLLDPACGSGHMLTYAFDLLYTIYEEEGYTPSSIPELILTHNLRGLEIDERAAQLASFALAMKARGRDRRFFTRRTADDRPVQPDIIRVTPVVFDEIEAERITGGVAPGEREMLARLLHSFADADTFGSLIRVDPEALGLLDMAVGDLDETHDLDMFSGFSVGAARILLRQAKALVDNQYHVVVANPPYLGSGNMGGLLKGWVAKNYPDAKADLLTAFMVRAAEVCVPSGQWGMVVLPSWMFLNTFVSFREWFLGGRRIESFLHLGRGLFGSDFGSDAFTVTNMPAPQGYRGVYRRLFEEHVQVRKPYVIEALFLDPGYNRFDTAQSDFALVPESPIVYWLSDAMKGAFAKQRSLANDIGTREGLTTGDNAAFLREWFEVSLTDFSYPKNNSPERRTWNKRWYPYQKGGAYRKWYGNSEFVVDWEDDGRRQRMNVDPSTGRVRSHNYNLDYAFVAGFTWTGISSGGFCARVSDEGYMFDTKGPMGYPKEPSQTERIIGLINSSVGARFLEIISPTIDYKLGHLLNVPSLQDSVSNRVSRIVNEIVSCFRNDWNEYETSWDFEINPLAALGIGSLEAHAKTRWDEAIANTKRAQELEVANNGYFATLYELQDEVQCSVPLNRVSLTQNPYFRYAPTRGNERDDDEYRVLFFRDVARELVSYAVGVMMGRYSLDKPGLVLADAGATVADFDKKVPDARFRPDVDGILPITAERYFEDDIVARLRQFLAVAFGAEHLEANVSWLEHALGSGRRKNLRDYFLNDFYADHLKTYSSRPIYWQVSSPNGGFSALFYLHRYTPATLGLIHQNYAEELLGKLQARLDTIEHALPSADKREATQLGKERDRLTVQRREVRDWIDKALFPLASAEIALDLDDGVKQNYPKLMGVVKKVTRL
ncbi:BREX-1 system adenine-specific DNA-methyltransferase PglX [Antrihabitans cavernicola]|uniref:site-specific DNA-methyltransferase (adenine-specific) n=1 Tax=Antrihabitans cavernicola TaxID=2495913 RepID=A0A5A7S5W7_9NOCA|nr:BREX-1 system adenine-specific DNA-methyltransferase PglX [Spelaeibacter cavernicola]KAA0021558.1 BREX-1 system adenine-specific DNA-methyltransferase PglX [Spelaeibacter cavernicola]